VTTTTPDFFTDGKLKMGMQIRGGPWKIVPLASQSMDPALVFSSELQAVRAASYEKLAARIIEDPDWNATRQVFVTSPDPGDGKTSSAFNLAWALSTRAKPVLLVELNLRSPRFGAMLGNPRIRYGVDSVLRGIATPRECVFSLVNEDLHVAAARDAMSYSEIRRFQSGFNALISWAKQEYQWVVFDCPSVLSLAWNDWHDANAKSVLMIVRNEHTPEIDVRRASKRLGDRLKGVALNITNTGS
jgi:Mrp family chromosome partitioning ATPase